MKFLFDQNISHRMIALLEDIYPNATHVSHHDLQRADDETVWNFAKSNNLVIVSKDADFHQRSFLYGFPPKVIWLRRGNCSTKELSKILRSNRQKIEQFLKDDQAAFLALS